ncbi:MAG: putative hydro-lyase [Pseudomonadota bacterium]
MADAAIAGSETVTHDGLQAGSVGDVRAAIRRGAYCAHTAGLAKGRLQANLVVLPEAEALDFARFCQRNPKPCPLVGMTDTGSALMTTLGSDLDIRTDIPKYNVYRDGGLVDQPTDIRDLWRDDFVAFAIGCSFTFEHALMSAGVPMFHIEDNRTVPMFRTSLRTVPAGKFGGGMVVSMRPVRQSQLEMVTEICRRYPQAHGTPIHVGDGTEIGISDLSKPDWGTPTPVPPEHVPVFWGCGVTPQNAVVNARLPLCITHTPGCMIVTDVAEGADPPVLAA